ncbi:uncharacterized protein LOC110054394 [Orbicella faveolata]|uniref:uncharacterized protein LOC110054394 n=1 Tax=Orbicella faveolata TaxID=48498 RepID=UPI0009E61DC2|nr:uncharacterized protein LOC110054394 [Orbicella faveolata]
MAMFGSFIKISFVCFALISQLSQASPLPGIEDKIKSETEAAKETALNDAKAADRMVFNKETKHLADELSKLKREYDELKAYTSTQDTRIGELESKAKDRSSALSGDVRSKRHTQQVSCYNDYTSWDARSDASIMYLDRQDVSCPQPYFLSRFRLVRRGDYGSADVRYSYRCCRVL